MKSANRYLIQRDGLTWYYDRGIPKDIQKALGLRSRDTKSLETSDLKIARELRDIRAAKQDYLWAGIREKSSAAPESLEAYRAEMKITRG